MRVLVRVSSPGPLVNAFAVFVAVVLLEDASRRVHYQPLSVMCAWPLALLVAAIYFVRLVILRPFGGHDPVRRTAWRWALAPLCGVAVVSSLVYPWPMAVRFSLSKPAFERALAEGARDGTWTAPRWVGLYRVSRIEAQVDGTTDFVVGSSSTDSVAITHLPGGTSNSSNWRRIDGDWFVRMP